MERLLARLERRFGRYAVPNLIGYVVGGMALVWVLSTQKPEFVEHLTLDLAAVRRGQVWRLITFLFIPPPSSPIWLLVNLYFTWWIGSSLEQSWGALKFNAYYFVGVLGTIAAALVLGAVGLGGSPVTNFWLDLSLLLAFATVFPEASILLFFVIPVRVKWIGVIAAIFVVYSAATGGWGTRAAVVAALANYALFFSDHWAGTLKHRSVIARQRARLEGLRSNRPNERGDADDEAQREPGAPAFGKRVCAICGASETEGTDIRVCSCDKCGNKPRTLCLEHARAH
jgi:hypothetical protein